MNQNSNNNSGKKPEDNNRSPFKRLLPAILLALVLTLLFNSVQSSIASAHKKEITYTEFVAMADKQELSEVTFTTDRILILTKTEAEKPKNERITHYTGIIKNVDLTDLVTQLRSQGVKVKEEVIEEMSPIISFLLSWILPLAIMFGLLSLLTKSMEKRMGGMGGFGQSKAKVYMEKQTGVTFADVAGQD